MHWRDGGGYPFSRILLSGLVWLFGSSWFAILIGCCSSTEIQGSQWHDPGLCEIVYWKGGKPNRFGGCKPLLLVGFAEEGLRYKERTVEQDELPRIKDGKEFIYIDILQRFLIIYFYAFLLFKSIK